MNGPVTATMLPGDSDLIGALREGAEDAFAYLVGRHHAHLVRAATNYVRDPVAAEDVAQETWLGFLGSLDRFEGRCSLKTWLFRILFNKAQTRVKKDTRCVPFSTLVGEETSGEWASVDPSYFKGPDDEFESGHWVEHPPAWKIDPVLILEETETRELVLKAIAELPPAQGTVMLLRDVHGLDSAEVCNNLGITDTNQRVLLHRARTKVRRVLSQRYGIGH